MTEKKIIVANDVAERMVKQQEKTNEILTRMDKRQTNDWVEFKKAKKRQAWVERIGLLAVCTGLYFLPEEVKVMLNQFYSTVQGLMEWVR